MRRAIPKALSLAAAVVVCAAAGGAPRTSVTTVASFPGVVRALDVDGARLAWIDSAWIVRVRSGSETHSIVYTNPYEEIPDLVPPRRLFLEADRLLWKSERGSGTFGTVDHVVTATVGTRTAHRLANLSRVDDADGGYLTGIAGDRAGFAFGTAVVAQNASDQSFSVSGGGVWVVDGGVKRQLPGVSPSIVLAREGDLVAVNPIEGTAGSSGVPEGTDQVEVRSVSTGDVVMTVSPSALRAVAFSGRTLTVLAGSRLIRYSIDSGTEIGTTAVPGGTVADLDAAGGRVVFRTARAVDVFNVATGRITTIVRASGGWHPVAEAISGDTLVWAVEKHVAPGEPSRRTVISAIRRTTLH